MSYSKFSPSPELNPYVEFYYIWESQLHELNHLDVNSSPNYSYVLLFNYGDYYQLFNCNHNGTYLPVTFLSGPSLEKFTLKLNGKIGMLGVVFRGAAFRNLFSISNPAEFINNRIDLELLLGNEARLILEQIAGSPTDSYKIKVIENYLIYLLKRKKASSNPIDRAVELMLDRRGMMRVDDLAFSLNMCQRNFRRRFLERVGMSPKYFLRLKRFNYINLLLHRYPNLPWHDFVFDGGYYDQSHLIKDFHEFTGQKPAVLDYLNIIRDDTQRPSKETAIYSK